MKIETKQIYASPAAAVEALAEYRVGGRRYIELVSVTARREADLFSMFEGIQSLVLDHPRRWNTGAELLPVREQLLSMTAVVSFERTVTFPQHTDRHVEYGQIAQRLFETIGVVQAGVSAGDQSIDQSARFPSGSRPRP